MRLFVALTLTAKQRQKIDRAARALRERDLPVRWSSVDDLHVTLKFLGSVDPSRIELVEQALLVASEKSNAFTVSTGGFGAFPSIRRPRVLWVGVEASPALRCLKQDIEFSLSDLGFERETRAFHPHVTIGRTRDEGGAGDFRGLDDVAAGISYSGEINVRAVSLMRSQVKRDGPRYSVLSTSPLGKS